MHQRSCRIIKDLSGETFERQNTVEFVPNSVVSSTIDDEVLTKVGVNLPKSVDQWKSANDYFKTSLPIHSIALSDLNAVIITMNTTIYDYFEHNFGTVKSAKTLELNTKYKDFSKQSLKSCLKQLKSTCADPADIKVVSNLLRCKLKKTKPILNEGQVDDKIKKNFWGFVKNLFNKSTSSLPTFEVSTCTNFFSNLFSAIDPFKLFKIPDWIPSLSAPTIPFDLSPPSYHQITKVVRRIKASGSPCPLDQISIIPFKRCPYLRSYLTEIFRIMWQSGEIPDVWKKACTVLVHKKGDQSDPANFRPITLECTPLKIFTSCLRDSMFAFLSANGYIEHHIQKGFMPKLSGTYEHTAQMAHIINRARIKQRSVVITLLDLKTAFGEVHHNLIPVVLNYHHIPDQIQALIMSLYSNFHISILSEQYRTPFIKVDRGVLQGDSLSPLTFNLCFNTFIRYIADQKFNQFRFMLNSLNPTHWFQFADDAAVITSLENENQILLHHFSRWCNWAGMKIRVDKCSTFGIKKAATSSCQYLPKLIINNSVVPTVAKDMSFKYLGRYFNFTMDNSDHMSTLLNSINDLMVKIDCLPCHPKNKLLLYHRFVLSKLSWHMTIADLSKTWVVENLDNIVSSFVRKWLELPVSATFSSLILNKSKYGISLVLPSTKFTECPTTMRNALKSSPNQDIKCLWAETSYGTNLQYDQFKNTKQVLKTIQHDHEEPINNTLLSQGLVLSSILKFACNKTNSLWSTVQQSLPRNIFTFSIKYLNNTLPTRKNLCKWSISQSSSCSFCLQSETLQHVVSSCSSYLDEGRYTWRHNSVLLFLANTFSSFKQCTVYADLPFFLSPSLITGESLRSDLLLLTKDKSLYILELTIGFETNIQNNSNRKAAKYSSLLSELSPSYSKVTFVNLSMGAIGTMGSSCTSFFSLLNELSFDKTIQKRVIMKAMTISIRSSYFIFCQRNKPWTNPDLLTI